MDRAIRGMPPGGATPRQSREPSPRGAGILGNAGRSSCDARVLPVLFGADGGMYREFRAAVEMCRQVEIKAFVVHGPRTALWCLKFILENGGTPMGRHTKFKADAKLSSSDPGVHMHHEAMRLIQTALCIDQLDGSNSATVELLCREAQMVEEKYAAKLRMVDPFVEDGEYFMKTHAGQSNVMMAPALREWIAEQMKADAAVLKERRKAREERQLTSGLPADQRDPNPNKNKKNKKDKGQQETPKGEGGS